MSTNPNEPLIQLIKTQDDPERWRWVLLTPTGNGDHKIHTQGQEIEREFAARDALEAVAEYEAEQNENLLLTVAEAKMVANPVRFVNACDGRYSEFRYGGETVTLGEWSNEAAQLYGELKAVGGYREANDACEAERIPTAEARTKFWTMAALRLQDRGWQPLVELNTPELRHLITFSKGGDHLTMGWAIWGGSRKFGWSFDPAEEES